MARRKPVTPDQRIRELRTEFRRLQKDEEDPGPDRSERFASFARAAHEERQLNMAMHAATRSLEEDPDAPDLLVRAYLPADLDDPEERLRALVDLKDLARYVGDTEVAEFVDHRADDEATTWVRTADASEQRYRLRALTSMFSQGFADQVRDRLGIL